MNIFKQLFLSISNPKAIAEFRYQSVGKSILYVFFLTFILFIPIAYSIYYGFDYSRDAYDEFVSENNETFEIVDGQLVAAPVESYIHKIDIFVVIVDSTTNEVDLEEINNAPYVAFLQTEMEVYSGLDTKTVTYEQLGIENLSNEDFQSIISSSSTVVLFAYLLIFYWSMVASSIILICLFALVLRIVSSNPTKPRKLSYANFWTISAYSTTVMTLFIALMSSFGIDVVAQNFISWVVSTIIGVIAIKAIPVEEKL